MNVKGVRKTCAVVFGLLSIFFAVVALHNQFFAEKAGKDCAEAAALNFDSGVESAAREQDKLIFLTVDSANSKIIFYSILLNAPCIMIQRYNRPRFERLLRGNGITVFWSSPTDGKRKTEKRKARQN